MSVKSPNFVHESKVLLPKALSIKHEPETKDNSTQTSPTIGLALSGGAALGFAHIGVLKVLEEEGIPVSYIAGNSMGAMVGGIYAAGYSPVEMESIVLNANWSRLFSANPPFGALYLPERQQNQRYPIQLRHRNFFPALPSGLIPLQNVEFLLMKLLARIEYDTDYDFDKLPIPYRAVAVDLVTGQKKVIKNGRLSKAIRASIAIPGVFAPEEWNDEQLVDGGVQQYLPVDPLLEFKPDFIIAVLTMKHNQSSGGSLIDVISRTVDIVGIEDLNRQKRLADILIEPDVDPFLHSDFARAKELIAAGEVAARKALPEIYAKLGNQKPKNPRQSIKLLKPLPLISSIHFEGLRITHPQLLDNEITISPGNYLDFEQLLNDLNRLFNTGLFENVNYRLEFIGKDWVEIIIVVKERAYGFYSLGLRYDNTDNLSLGLEVGQGNLWGSGAGIRSVIHLGNPNEYRLGLTGTRLFRLPFGYRLDGFWRSRENSYFAQGKWRYQTNFFGGVAELGYILGHNGYFNIGFLAYEAHYEMPPAPIFSVIPVKEKVIGPTILLEFNNFDDLFFPTRGLTYRLTGSLASKKLKSSENFLKIDITATRIVPFTAWFLLRYGIKFGDGFGKLPWAELFRSGGEGLIGFAQDEFTTNQKAIFQLSTDFRLFRLFNQDNYPVYLQLISNIATFEKLNRLVTNPLLDTIFHWGAGIGLRTNTPIGPFQFVIGVADFAKNRPYPTTRINLLISVGRDYRYSKN